MERQRSDKDEQMILMQRCVKKFHFGNWEEKEKAAKDIEMLAKEDVKITKLMTELGVVSLLVSMASRHIVTLLSVTFTVC
ncbi:hypothetical protein L195_g010855 [Trifolium pratense]|uniref:Uncharacterized protein n=1 Tax=Trifolium pratense TaxID=57577 RepID=A0A2K3PFX2_TRIPR|nr:hypothetical protein L195_g010855 [Trifolium pratense]